MVHGGVRQASGARTARTLADRHHLCYAEVSPRLVGRLAAPVPSRWRLTLPRVRP